MEQLVTDVEVSAAIEAAGGDGGAASIEGLGNYEFIDSVLSGVPVIAEMLGYVSVAGVWSAEGRSGFVMAAAEVADKHGLNLSGRSGIYVKVFVQAAGLGFGSWVAAKHDAEMLAAARRGAKNETPASC
jgi:hypothetical protein